MTSSPIFRLNNTATKNLMRRARESHIPVSAIKLVVGDMTGEIQPCLRRREHGIVVNAPMGQILAEASTRYGIISEGAWARYERSVINRFETELALLGSTAGKVSRTLSSLGVMGVRGDACGCPLFNWATKVYGAWSAVIGQNEMFIDGYAIDTPEPISEFVHNFDHQYYPSLDSAPIDRLVP